MSVHAHERTRASLALPALAAFAAAAVGGIVWGLVVKYTQYEVGFLAWGIGLITGVAAVTAARGLRSVALAATAVVAALGGIVLGKYLSYQFWGDTNGYTFSAMWSWFDALWIGLAVVTAARIAGDQDESEPEPVP
jgi:hypothetical protein